MARPLRITYEGAVYHVTIRGNERRALFLSTEDHERFMQKLADRQWADRSYVQSTDIPFEGLWDALGSSTCRTHYGVNCFGTVKGLAKLLAEPKSGCIALPEYLGTRSYRYISGLCWTFSCNFSIIAHGKNFLYIGPVSCPQ